MSYQSFECAREDIESIFRPVQRNILIAEYCSDNFGYINLVDFYYRKTDANAILIFLFICTIYPVLFMNIAAIADKYLSVGMQDLSKRFHLSPTIAAVTLIAFANGSPDVLASFSSADKPEGAFISLGALFGAFIFSTTLVISNVMFNAKEEILMPKFAVLKELVFYLCSLIVVCIFGFIQTAGYPFIFTYLGLYVLYIIATIIVDKMDAKARGADEEEEGLDMEGRRVELTGASPGTGPEKENTSMSRAYEVQVRIVEDDNEDPESKEKGVFTQLVNELIEEEASFLQNFAVMPLMAAGLFTVPYLSNPLMKFPMSSIIVSLSVAFTLFSLEFVETLLLALIIGLAIGAIFLVLELINFKRGALEISYELISVFAAVGWINVFSTLVIDFISFLAFYFSINEVILSSLLLSAGNTIGDFFGNAALAKQGEAVMGAIASYSGQIFNNFIGFSANQLVKTLGGDTDFDIFALSYYEKHKGEDDVPPPLGQYFLMCVVGFVGLIITLKLIYYPLNRYVLKKSFSYILISIYAIFFVASMIFGLMSRV